MRWPQTADYGEAIQNLAVTFRDSEIRQASPVTGALGLPVPRTGSFAAVFPIRSAASGVPRALKCFTRPVRGLQERYQRIAAHLAQHKLPFMVEFGYLPDEVLIRGHRFPVLKMDWIEGLRLDEFLAECLARKNPQPALRMLCGMWVRLAQRLHGAEIAHGDLQHGNVLLVPVPGKQAYNVRLIDYDGMHVPALADMPPGEVGHAAYQHPQRLRQGAFGPEIDRFSHLLMYTTFSCLITGGRELWERYYDGDRLLFGPRDLAAPQDSPLCHELWGLADPDARSLVGHLILAARGPLDQVPALDQVVVDSCVLPLTEAQQRQVAKLLSAGEPVDELVVEPVDELVAEPIGEPPEYGLEPLPSLTDPAQAVWQEALQSPETDVLDGQATAVAEPSGPATSDVSLKEAVDLSHRPPALPSRSAPSGRAATAWPAGFPAPAAWAGLLREFWLPVGAICLLLFLGTVALGLLPLLSRSSRQRVPENAVASAAVPPDTSSPVPAPGLSAPPDASSPADEHSLPAEPVDPSPLDLMSILDAVPPVETPQSHQDAVDAAPPRDWKLERDAYPSIAKQTVGPSVLPLDASFAKPVFPDVADQYKMADDGPPALAATEESEPETDEIKEDEELELADAEAVPEAEELWDVSSVQYVALISAARKSLEGGDVKAAREKLQDAAADQPDVLWAHFYLGLLEAVGSDSPKSARRHFIRCVRSAPRNAACLNNLAVAEVRSKRVPEAVALFGRALQYQPETAEVRHNADYLLSAVNRGAIQMLPRARESLQAKGGSEPPANPSMIYSRSYSTRGEGLLYMDSPRDGKGLPRWAWPSLSDPTCLGCDGRGRVACSNSACKNGKIRVPAARVITAPGARVPQKMVGWQTCRNCNGTGGQPCPFCRGSR